MLEIIIAAVAVALDQWTKWGMSRWLTTLPDHSFPVIDGIFHFTYVENRGAAFGIMQGQQTFFLILTPIVVGVLIGFMIRKRKTLGVWLRVALSLVIAGAVGNYIDRLWKGYVRDLFDFRAINFAVFNLADACITVAAIMLIVYLLIIEPRQKKKLEQSGLAPDNQGDRQNGSPGDCPAE